jgi:hypothetical protein
MFENLHTIRCIGDFLADRGRYFFLPAGISRAATRSSNRAARSHHGGQRHESRRGSAFQNLSRLIVSGVASIVLLIPGPRAKGSGLVAFEVGAAERLWARSTLAVIEEGQWGVASAHHPDARRGR